MTLHSHPHSYKPLLSIAFMGKRSSSAAGAAAKKAKTANIDASVVGNWVSTKMGSKEMSAAEKIGLLKNDPAESLAAGPEIIPRLPPGFRVIFLAFLLRGLSLPPTSLSLRPSFCIWGSAS
jgi:hypothetical protein